MGLETEMDRQRKKHGGVYLKALSIILCANASLKNASIYLFLRQSLFGGKSPPKRAAGTVPGIFIPVDNRAC